MFKKGQVIRLKDGSFDIIEYVSEEAYEMGSGGPLFYIVCRNGTYDETDIAQIEGELK